MEDFMSSFKNKVDFAVVIQVNRANPNGDPLNDNRPRTTYDGYGEISDVCLKRKIRDRLAENGLPIFIISDDKKTDDATSLRDRATKALGKALMGSEIETQACLRWFDVRAFGQLFAFKSSKDKDTATGDTGVSIGIRGPVTIQHAISVEPVSVTSMQIIKSTCSEEPKDGKKKSSDTMGMKHYVNHGIYVFKGSINIQQASRTSFSAEDAEILKNILPKMFENDASAARPEGSMEVLKVIWWEQLGYGKHSSAKVHHSLSVNPDGTYEIANLEGITPEVIDGY